MKTQAKIGYIFSILGLLIYIIVIISIISSNRPILVILSPANISILIISGIMLFTAIYKTWISRAIQVSLIFIVGVLSYILTPDKPFAGIIIVYISMSIAHSYRLFDTKKILKYIIIFAIIFICFSINMVETTASGMLNAIYYTALIAGLHIVTIIIYKTEAEKNEQRYLEVLEEAMEVAREYREMLKKIRTDRSNKDAER